MASCHRFFGPRMECIDEHAWYSLKEELPEFEMGQDLIDFTVIEDDWSSSCQSMIATNGSCSSSWKPASLCARAADFPSPPDSESTPHGQHDATRWRQNRLEWTTVSDLPNFNADNCSCTEVAFQSQDGQHFPQSPFYERPRFHYENKLPVYFQQTRSYAYSSIPVPSPEGPEREGTNIPSTNNFLPWGPEAGLNETQRRPTASFHSDLFYQMRKFLVEQEEHQHPAANTSEHGPMESRFLPQDIYIQEEAPGKCKKGKLSYMNASTSIGYASFFSWDVDPRIGIGARVDADENLYDYAENSNPIVVGGDDKMATPPFTSLPLISRTGLSRGSGWLFLLSATYENFLGFEYLVLVTDWLTYWLNFNAGSALSAILPVLGPQASTRTRGWWKCCKCLCGTTAVY